MFEFSLRALEEITPWGDQDTDGGLSLHWFGLTDGWYSIKTGETTHFQYTKEMLQHLRIQFPAADLRCDKVDYQVVRLYEDLLDILPRVMEDVPEPVHKLVSSVESYREWRAFVNRIDLNDFDELKLEVYDKAFSWLSERRLDSLYLQSGPRLWFWRRGENVYSLWDNSDLKEDGIDIWTADAGICSIRVPDFLGQIDDFHSRLMTEMRLRVREISMNNPFIGVNIDIKQLLCEQSEREGSLDRARSLPIIPTDWDLVFQSYKILADIC